MSDPSLPTYHRDHFSDGYVIETDGGNFFCAHGETIALSHVAAHRSEHLWGDKSEEFDPDRSTNRERESAQKKKNPSPL